MNKNNQQLVKTRDSKSVTNATITVGPSGDERTLVGRVLSDPRILATILQHLLRTPSAFLNTSLVNKLWSTISTNIFWHDIPAGAIRPILFTLPEYRECHVRCINRVFLSRVNMWFKGVPYLTDPPTIYSWTRFQDVHAPQIHTLHLDLKTIYTPRVSCHVSQIFLREILCSFPKNLSLPQLRKLHVVLNIDLHHINLIQCLQPRNVEHLSIELYTEEMEDRKSVV